MCNATNLPGFLRVVCLEDDEQNSVGTENGLAHRAYLQHKGVRCEDSGGEANKRKFRNSVS